MKIFVVIFALLLFFGTTAQTHVFKPLPYAYDALEPYIDAKTMEIHYTKHHRGYYDKFMAAIKGNHHLESLSLPEIMARMNEFPAAVRNNGGGFWNHEFFWESMTPGGSSIPEGALKNRINAQFGSMEKFIEEFKNAGLSIFGSGWVWLIQEKGALKIVTTPNQDNPLMNVPAGTVNPLLALDVWEHAYYLKHQNKRAAYIDDFFKVIDWIAVSKRFNEKL